MTIGEEIKAIRKELRMTKHQFADWVGVSEVTVRWWECEKKKPHSYVPNLLRNRISNPQLWNGGWRAHTPESMADLIKLTHMTQMRFAAYIDVSRRTVQDWIYCGKVPPKYFVELLRFKIYCDYIHDKK